MEERNVKRLTGRELAGIQQGDTRVLRRVLSERNGVLHEDDRSILELVFDCPYLRRPISSRR